jgi:probable phosphoglycerate mutase
MTDVLLIRHGPTDWNAKGRIQGQTDVSLSADGRAQVSRWSVPVEFHSYEWFASPLARARETAQLLGVPDARPEPRLMEMSWGRWEGRTWEEVCSADAAAVAQLETRGLDFQPPEGESRRALRQRLCDWLSDVTVRATPVAAVTHRGVIHAALALATGWNMCGRPPHRLDWSRAHLFRLRADGRLFVDTLNVGLSR